MYLLVCMKHQNPIDKKDFGNQSTAHCVFKKKQLTNAIEPAVFVFCLQSPLLREKCFCTSVLKSAGAAVFSQTLLPLLALILDLEASRVQRMVDVCRRRSEIIA